MFNSLNNAVITITGGTGSFGSTMARSLLKEDVSEIRIFSRDETKQDEMRRTLNDDRAKFYIGDVRDSIGVENAINGSDFVFHAAALKQVPSCEFFPVQASLTNVTGSANVIEASIKSRVKGIVCLSTDKAVYPINAMGMTKGLMEKVAQSYARNPQSLGTKVAITRYGNVMMSRGSVIPLFFEQIRLRKPITITDPSMTRFLMSLEDSVDLVKYAFKNANSGDLFVKKAPACTVEILAKAMIKIMNAEDKVEIKYIGTRHGEKLYESLLSSEESVRAEDLGGYFKVPLDTRTLDYQPFFQTGSSNPSEVESYNSHNTTQLSVDEVVALVENLQEFKKLSETFSR